MKRRSWMTLGLGLASISILINCTERVGFTSLFAKRTGTNPGIDIECGKDGFCTETYVQPNKLITKDALIIFTMDGSGSMNLEFNEVKDGAGQLIQKLTTITDKVCVGVMGMYTNAPLQNGLTNQSGLLVGNGADKCLCTDALAINDLLAKLSQNFEFIRSAQAIGQNEAGLKAIDSYATEAAKIAANEATGCVPDTAVTAFIPISDENDLSAAEIPAAGFQANCAGLGVQNVGTTVSPAAPSGQPADGSCQEFAGRAREYSTLEGTNYKLTVTPTKVSKDLALFMGTLPFKTYSVIYPDQGSITQVGGGNQDGIGYGYLEFIQKTGGDVVNMKLLKNNDKTEFLNRFSEIGDDLIDQAALFQTFNTQYPVCEDSVKIKVDGVSIDDSDFQVISDTTIRIPNEHGQADSVIEITYKQKIGDGSNC